MSVLSYPGFGPRAALMYITGGCLIDVWVTVWYFAFVRGDQSATNSTWFWLFGLFFTGLTFLVIGLRLGNIAQAARRAEMPPAEVLSAEARIQNTAAGTPDVVMPAVAAPGAANVANPAIPVMPPGVQPTTPMAPTNMPNAAPTVR